MFHFDSLENLLQLSKTFLNEQKQLSNKCHLAVPQNFEPFPSIWDDEKLAIYSERVVDKVFAASNHCCSPERGQRQNIKIINVSQNIVTSQPQPLAAAVEQPPKPRQRTVGTLVNFQPAPPNRSAEKHSKLKSVETTTKDGFIFPSRSPSQVSRSSSVDMADLTKLLKKIDNVRPSQECSSSRSNSSSKETLSNVVVKENALGSTLKIQKVKLPSMCLKEKIQKTDILLPPDKVAQHDVTKPKPDEKKKVAKNKPLISHNTFELDELNGINETIRELVETLEILD